MLTASGPLAKKGFRPLAGKWINEPLKLSYSVRSVKRFRPLAGKWINELEVKRSMQTPPTEQVSVPLRGSGLMNDVSVALFDMQVCFRPLAGKWINEHKTVQLSVTKANRFPSPCGEVD